MSIDEKQHEVEEFVNKNSLGGTIEYRIMDLVSEVGDVVKEAPKSADYGLEKENLDVKEDEVGELIFYLLMVCNDFDIDAEGALDTALKKYERRLDENGDIGSE